MDVRVWPLLTLFALTVVVTTIAQWFPPARWLALLLDSLPIGGVVAATIFATVRLRRVKVVRIRRMVAVYGYFVGALIGTLGVAHSTAVTLAAIERGLHQQFVYSFRFYSLVLFGVLLILGGLTAANDSLHLTRGDRTAWRASLSLWAALLAINLPLVTLQRFAVVFSLLIALELLFLGGVRRHFDAEG